MLTPAEIMMRSRIKLLKTQPFFGTLAMNLVLQPDNAIPTMATDYHHLFYNEEFIAQQYALSPKLVISAIAHENGHVHLMHNTREGNRDKQLWNMAGDYVINAMLKNCGMEIGKDWLYDAAFEGMTTEQVYEHLKKIRPEKEKHEGFGGQCCLQPHAGNDGKDMTAGVIADIEATIKTRIAAAAQVARQQGMLPAFMEAEIEGLLNPPERWQDILREFITNISRDDYSWQRTNRRHINRGIILPSLHSERMGEIVVALDSSGSCMAEFGLFLDNLNSIIEDCRPELVTVLHCDADIAKVETYTADELPIQRRLFGGGGTDFRPVFEYVTKQDIEPVCLVYFTDTYGTFPKQEPDYPVLWAVTENNAGLPWGNVITVRH